jgi:hypothetical protein
MDAQVCIMACPSPIPILLVAATLIGVLPAAGQTAAERVIVQDVKLGLPPSTPCAVTNTAFQVARVVGEPIGIEGWPEPCPVPPPRSIEDTTEWLTLTGLNAAEALDRLMQVDSRYEWREMDGVIVVRPRIAWTDPDHFLHRTVNSFTVRNQHLGGTLEAVIDTLGPFPWPAREPFLSTTRLADRVISVNLGPTSIIDTLNAVVRTHGAMSWSVRYCNQEAIHENAWFTFFTFDLAGTMRPALPFDADGNRHSCGDKGSQ